MIGRILVALDGSPLAEAILPHVTKLIDEGTHVTLLLVEHRPQPVGRDTVVDVGIRHAVGSFGGQAVLTERRILHAGEDRTQAIEAVEDEGLKYLATVGRPLMEAGAALEYHATISEEVAETISEYASSNGFDLIAMATHAREGLSRLVSGSIAGKVLELAPMPVLLVRSTD